MVVFGYYLILSMFFCVSSLQAGSSVAPASNVPLANDSQKADNELDAQTRVLLIVSSGKQVQWVLAAYIHSVLTLVQTKSERTFNKFVTYCYDQEKIDITSFSVNERQLLAQYNVLVDGVVNKIVSSLVQTLVQLDVHGKMKIRLIADAVEAGDIQVFE